MRQLIKIGLTLSLLISTISVLSKEVPARELIYPMNNTVYVSHFGVLLIGWIIWLGFSIWLGRKLYLLNRSDNKPSANPYNTLLFMGIPVLIGLALLIVSTHVVASWRHKTTQGINIKIHAYHWPNKYDYSWQDPTTKQQFTAFNKDIIIPTQQTVFLTLNAKVVNKSWSLSQWAKEHELLPGFWHQTQFHVSKPGFYKITCKHNCALDYGFMPLQVTAVNKPDYLHWRAALEKKTKNYSATLAYAQIVHEGKIVYKNYCSSCHMPNGQGIPNAVPPLTSGVTNQQVMRQIDHVANGIPHHGMPAYGKKLDNESIAAVVDYINTQLGLNNSNAFLAQAKDVRTARQHYYG